MNYFEWHRKISPRSQDLHGHLAIERAAFASAGLPIPPSLCLNANAYRDFLQETGIEGKLRDILITANPEDSINVLKNCAVISKIFRSTALPPLIMDQLKSHYAAISSLASHNNDDDPLVELIMNEIGYKLPGDDFLNTRLGGCRDRLTLARGIHSLEFKIRSEWSSFWTDWLDHWLAFPECDAINIDLAINIQLHLEPEFCGQLGFNLANWPKEIFIEASWGRWGWGFFNQWLPAHSGIKTGWDSVHIDSTTGRVIDYMIGEKRRFGKCGENGSIIEYSVPADKQYVPVLTEAHIQTLLDFYSTAEACFDGPLVLSWMFVGGKYYIIDIQRVDVELTKSSKSKVQFRMRPRD